MVTAERILSRKTVVGYAVGSLGTGGFSTLPGLGLVYYLTDTLGVAALAAAILVTAAKIWDVLINPVIGARSDRSRLVTRSSRRFMVLGGALIHTTHLTVTPVTEGVLAELSEALVEAADEVRGVPTVSASQALAALPVEALAGLASPDAAMLDSATAYAQLAGIGLVDPSEVGAPLPDRMAPILALVETLPAALTERLLTELLARLIEPG